MHDHQNYNLLLIVLSYAVSVLGSFTALQLAVMIPLTRTRRQRVAAVLTAGAVMGVGAIWSMHFIAMLACDMGVQVTYDVSLTALSALMAFVACSVGLWVAASGTFSGARLVFGGVCMGFGVVSMHYVGMAAMLVAASMSYDMNIVTGSVAIAIIASIAALWLASHMRGAAQLTGSALVMGLAVCGMHYTGMAALHIYDNGGRLPAGYMDGIHGNNLGMTIFGVVVAVLAIVLVVHHLHQRRRAAIAI
ncbi:MHYT domain-containing protein [Dyella sp.]|uniref:MHYT domain-containing protein n=1 Tax=Dyella sp. TaxID=1869338 RepID=UPI002ED0EB46